MSRYNKMDYKIPENMPLKEVMEYRVNKFKENNPKKPLNDMFSNLASNWDTYVQILDEATKSKDGSSQSVSKYALNEMHQFGYISIHDEGLANLKRERFYDDFVTSYRAQKTDYTITEKGRTVLSEIYSNKALISEFLNNYKTY